MPNHIMNHLKIDCPEERRREILKGICYEETEGTSGPSGPGTIDFNRLIPMDPALTENGGWYEWRIEHWGTKWNSYENVWNGGDTISFFTAWSSPEPVVRELSERYPDVRLEHVWADEDIGHNMGKRTYEAGEVTEEYECRTPREAMDFAFSAWGEKPEEFGYRISCSGNTYVKTDTARVRVVEFLDRLALYSKSRLTDDMYPEGMKKYELGTPGYGHPVLYVTEKVKDGMGYGGTLLVMKQDAVRLEQESGEYPLYKGVIFTGNSTTFDDFIHAQERYFEMSPGIEETYEDYGYREGTDMEAQDNGYGYDEYEEEEIELS